MTSSHQKKQANLRLIRSSPTPSQLEASEAQFMDEMLNAWYERRVGSLRHTAKSVTRDLRIVRDLTVYSGTPAWMWTERIFEQWCYHIGIERGLRSSTQRHYQSAIRGFLAYTIGNPFYLSEVPRRFGSTLRQVVTSENSIPHVHEDESSTPKREMTHEQIQTFFEVSDECIEEARRWNAKDFRPLQRDKTLYFLMYVTGARSSEASGLQMNSFLPNVDFPEFGEYGRVLVWGKGSSGSGPKQRTITIDHPDLPVLLEWYINDVRPHFLINANPNEDALFLSQHGRQISQSTVGYGFKKLLERANLDHFGFTPHSLRHSALTHGRMLTTVEVQQRKAGHAFSSTTEGYTHFSDDFIRKSINDVINTQLPDSDES